MGVIFGVFLSYLALKYVEYETLTNKLKDGWASVWSSILYMIINLWAIWVIVVGSSPTTAIIQL